MQTLWTCTSIRPDKTEKHNILSTLFTFIVQIFSRHRHLAWFLRKCAQKYPRGRPKTKSRFANLTKGTQTLQEIWNRIQIESEESTLGSGFFRLQSKIRFLKILIKGMHNPVLDLGIRIWIVQMERTLRITCMNHTSHMSQILAREWQYQKWDFS